MTRSELKIQAAKKRVAAAEARLAKARDAKEIALKKVSERTNPAIWKATTATEIARQRLAVAELAALGITPMQTIILYHPKYTGVTEQRRYVVRVTRLGWKNLVPVSKKGKIIKGRAEQYPPYNWSRVSVTDEVLREVEQ